MNNPFFKSLIITVIIMAFTFLVHSFFLFDNKYPEMLLKSYFINFMMASLVFAAIYRFKKTKSDLLGFYFLGGSFFKFIVFFVLFLPFFKADGDLSKQEFFIFFIPYIVVLFVEVSFLVNILNKES